jgi:hypothetical protein
MQRCAWLCVVSCKKAGEALGFQKSNKSHSKGKFAVDDAKATY